MDAFGNTATTYASVRISSSAAGVCAAADATLTNGAATFSVTLKTAGLVDRRHRHCQRRGDQHQSGITVVG